MNLSKYVQLRKSPSDQQGSLTLEQALFIGAIVSMFGLVSIFYTNLGNYFSGITFGTSPTDVGAVTSRNNTGNNTQQ